MPLALFLARWVYGRSRKARLRLEKRSGPLIQPKMCAHIPITARITVARAHSLPMVRSAESAVASSRAVSSTRTFQPRMVRVVETVVVRT